MNEYLEVAVALARAAGEIARAGFQNVGTDWKADNTPVTESDIAINRLVIETLTAHFPSHGILGEEASALQDGAELVWVCDPIDGTIPFALGVPTSAFSLALTQNGTVIVAVIYDFHGDRLLTAVRGEGTRCNGEPVRVLDQATLKSSVTDIEGIWMAGLYDEIDLVGLPALLEQEGSKLIKLSSTVYAGMLVALGRIPGVVTKGNNAWDVAALKLIVEEAGGRVTDLYGKDQRYDRPIRGCVLTNGQTHATYLSLIVTASGTA